MAHRASFDADNGQGSGAGEGFTARLTGSALSDLIQLECQDRAHKVVRVTAGGRNGLLFFRAGQVVHAHVHDTRQIGEAAVRTMLGWSGGRFERVSYPWPERESIEWPWQTLLLRAAHAFDEEAAGRVVEGGEESVPNVLTFPRREPPAAVMPLAPSALDGEDEVTKRTTISNGLEDATAPVTVRISPDGEITGGDADDSFAELSAFAVQIGDLLGGLLGASKVATIELAASRASAIVVRHPDDSIVAVRAPARTELSVLRERVRLT